jgi:pyruvate,water dikinase
MTYVEILSEATPNLSLFGGKGSNLINMIKLGISVPSGFIVNTLAYKDFLKKSPVKEEISKLFSTDFKSRDVINISSKIKNLFLKSKIPREVINEIKRTFDITYENLGENVSFSVRSSANIEDSSKYSFAGQAESYLHQITLEDILQSIKNCWISLFSPNALLYLLQMRKNNHQILLKELEMAVIVQKMINSQISGVLFTANVMNNSWNEMLINSTWGLGETITSNLIIPDLIILRKDKFVIIKKVIGDKEKMSIPNPSERSTTLLATDKNLQKVYSLDESQLFRLYKRGLKLEKCFNYPQDIEWAIEDDILYILQSRPITTLRERETDRI